MRLAIAILWSAAAWGSEIHQAAQSCRANVLTLLINNGAPLNERDAEGNTALHLAIRAGKPECVKLLLDAGADKRLMNHRFQTPGIAAMLIADKAVRDPILKLLYDSEAQMAAGTAPWTLHSAVLRGHTDVVAMLLKLHADPNAAGPDGNTPLHNAALKGFAPVVRLLLESGAKVDVRSKTGTLPLHDAAVGGSAEVVRLLIARGADVTAKTEPEGKTALDLAVSWERAEAAEALRKAGARALR
jgi:ankyrin repeat protein